MSRSLSETTLPPTESVGTCKGSTVGVIHHVFVRRGATITAYNYSAELNVKHHQRVRRDFPMTETHVAWQCTSTRLTKGYADF